MDSVQRTGGGRGHNLAAWHDRPQLSFVVTRPPIRDLPRNALDSLATGCRGSWYVGLRCSYREGTSCLCEGCRLRGSAWHGFLHRRLLLRRRGEGRRSRPAGATAWAGEPRNSSESPTHFPPSPRYRPTVPKSVTGGCPWVQVSWSSPQRPEVGASARSGSSLVHGLGV